MCFGSKGSSQPQAQSIPAPNPATAFDYNAARADMQRRADTAVNTAQTATMLSQTTPGAFGAELGGAKPTGA